MIVETTTLAEYYKLRDPLLARRFKEDHSPDAPICRWIHGAQKVDIMPVDGTVFGFRGSWFRAACDTAWTYKLGAECVIRVARAPEPLATKAEAFADRGKGDFVMSTDMEDFITIVDGRPELLDEIQASSSEVREYLRSSVETWLRNELFLEALPSLLPGDEASQRRIPVILARIRAIVRPA